MGPSNKVRHIWKGAETLFWGESEELNWRDEKICRGISKRERMALATGSYRRIIFSLGSFFRNYNLTVIKMLLDGFMNLKDPLFLLSCFNMENPVRWTRTPYLFKARIISEGNNSCWWYSRVFISNPFCCNLSDKSTARHPPKALGDKRAIKL